MAPTDSQKYLSTRGGSSGFSFEDVVIKGLAADGGLFIPEEIPKLPDNWESEWRDLSFQELAFQILSLYISPDEIPPEDLKDIITRSYSTFRHPDITPLVELDEDRHLYLLELFHGPTFAFKDVALQFLGNLFEYFLVRRNKGKVGKERHHLTVIGATSGDTGSAAIYGLRGKQDISVFILYPNGRVSPIQQAQMTTVLDANVHNLSVEGSFDDCQDAVKELFADPDLNKTHNTAAVNSINWARILAQMTYYFYSYFSLTRSPNYVSGTKTRFVVPSGNFGDILAGWFCKRMGLPVDKLVIATNENDILDRFFKSGGHYTKKPLDGGSAENAQHVVKETHSPAMDILVSSNFERLLWFLAYDVDTSSDIGKKRQTAGEKVKDWLNQLKAAGGFSVGEEALKAAEVDFESQRISDEQIIDTIRLVYSTPKTRQLREKGGYILDPHSAVGVAASLLSIEGNSGTNHISLSTAHPAKFVDAVDQALREEEGYDFSKVLPQEFVGLERKKSRVTSVPSGAGWEGIRSIVREEVEQELEGLR